LSVEAKYFAVDVYSSKSSANRLDDTGTVAQISITNYFKQKADTNGNVDQIDYSYATVKAILLKSVNTNLWTNSDGTNADLDADCLAQLVDIELVSTPKSGVVTISNDEKGAYTFKISATKQAVGSANDINVEKNATNNIVTGSTTFVVYNVDEAVTIDFDNEGCQAYDDGGNAIENEFYVNLDPAEGDETVYFSLSDVYAEYTKTTTNPKIKSKDITFVITDAKGNVVTEDDLKTAGTYYVKATVAKRDDNNKYVAGTDVAKVVVSYGNVASSNVFVSYKGLNVDTNKTVSVYYSAEDQAKDFSYLVKSTNGNITYTQGKDYEVTISTTIDGKTQNVDEIVDAGDYTVTIKGLSYTGSTSFGIEVKPATITGVTLNYDYNSNKDNPERAYRYTGEVITPEFTFSGYGAVTTITADDYDVYYVVASDD
jgi:hypothetical protein